MWFKKPTQPLNEYEALEEEYIKELLRQAKLTFNLAFGVTAASAIITLCGVGLLYLNKVPAASLTTVSGVLATITSAQFAKQSKDELYQIKKNLPK